MRLLGLTVVTGAALVFIAVPALAQGSRAAERAVTEAQGALENIDPTLKEIRSTQRGVNQTAVQDEKDTDQSASQTEQQNHQGKEKEKGKEVGVTNMPETGGFITGSGAALLGLGIGVTLVSVGALARKSI